MQNDRVPSVAHDRCRPTTGAAESSHHARSQKLQTRLLSPTSTFRGALGGASFRLPTGMPTTCAESGCKRVSRTSCLPWRSRSRHPTPRPIPRASTSSRGSDGVISLASAMGIHHFMRPSIHYESDDEVSVALADADPALGAVINRVGTVRLSPPSDPFVAIIRSIVGQQLSERAASAIFGRLSTTLGITPKALASADDAQLRAAGLSRQKPSYVQEIARRFLVRDFVPDRLKRLTDEEAISELMRLRGVGPWSAEIFLMYALGRPDILAVDDPGVRAQAGEMMGLGRAASRDELVHRAEAWRPHRSAASFYLMASRARSTVR